MQTFYISCVPKNTEEVMRLIKERPGYQYLGETDDRQSVFLVKAVSFHEAYMGLVRLATVSRSDPFKKKETMLA